MNLRHEPASHTDRKPPFAIGIRPEPLRRRWPDSEFFYVGVFIVPSWEWSSTATTFCGVPLAQHSADWSRDPAADRFADMTCSLEFPNGVDVRLSAGFAHDTHWYPITSGAYGYDLPLSCSVDIPNGGDSFGYQLWFDVADGDLLLATIADAMALPADRTDDDIGDFWMAQVPRAAGECWALDNTYGEVEGLYITLSNRTASSGPDVSAFGRWFCERHGIPITLHPPYARGESEGVFP
jgi:hypothetical protein